MVAELAEAGLRPSGRGRPREPPLRDAGGLPSRQAAL